MLAQRVNYVKNVLQQEHKPQQLNVEDVMAEVEIVQLMRINILEKK